LKQLNNIFEPYTPDYVVDEVNYYFQKIQEGKKDSFTLENAISLVNLAVVSCQINKEQGRKIKKQIEKIKSSSDIS
jgi:hypothetical protein